MLFSQEWIHLTYTTYHYPESFCLHHKSKAFNHVFSYASRYSIKTSGLSSAKKKYNGPDVFSMAVYGCCQKMGGTPFFGRFIMENPRKNG